MNRRRKRRKMKEKPRKRKNEKIFALHYRERTTDGKEMDARPSFPSQFQTLAT